LRRNSTPQEIILWSQSKSKQLGYKFRRQYSIGNYIVDFYCPEKNLIIEVDGWQHRKEVCGDYDIKRTRFLNSLGLEVLRFWNDEINRNLDGVISKIVSCLV